MDGFGYNNWKNTSYNDESYESSPDYSGYGSNRGGAGGKQNYSRKDDDDAYAFDISQEDSDYQLSPMATQKSTAGRPGLGQRQTSVADRAKEILERNKAAAPKRAPEPEADEGGSLEATFAALLEGIDIPKKEDKVDISSPPVSKGVGGGAGKQKSKYNQDDSMDDYLDSSSLNSPFGDSLDISAADLEVGALAARRAKEKANDRKRRQSIEQLPLAQQAQRNQSKANAINQLQAKISASPDVSNKRRPGQQQQQGRDQPGFQMSAALSSIDSLGNKERIGVSGGGQRYGSIERSDDDIYNMLRQNSSRSGTPTRGPAGGRGVNASPQVSRRASFQSDVDSELSLSDDERRNRRKEKSSYSAGGVNSSSSSSNGGKPVKVPVEASNPNTRRDSFPPSAASLGGGRSQYGGAGAGNQKYSSRSSSPGDSSGGDSDAALSPPFKDQPVYEDPDASSKKHGKPGRSAGGGGAAETGSGFGSSTSAAPARNKSGFQSGGGLEDDEDDEEGDEDGYSLDDFHGADGMDNTDDYGGDEAPAVKKAGTTPPRDVQKQKGVKEPARSASATSGVSSTGGSEIGKLTSVEEIMQRWHSIESDFIKGALEEKNPVQTPAPAPAVVASPNPVAAAAKTGATENASVSERSSPIFSDLSSKSNVPTSSSAAAPNGGGGAGTEGVATKPPMGPGLNGSGTGAGAGGASTSSAGKLPPSSGGGTNVGNGGTGTASTSSSMRAPSRSSPTSSIISGLSSKGAGDNDSVYSGKNGGVGSASGVGGRDEDILGDSSSMISGGRDYSQNINQSLGYSAASDAGTLLGLQLLPSPTAPQNNVVDHGHKRANGDTTLSASAGGRGSGSIDSNNSNSNNNNGNGVDGMPTAVAAALTPPVSSTSSSVQFQQPVPTMALSQQELKQQHPHYQQQQYQQQPQQQQQQWHQQQQPPPQQQQPQPQQQGKDYSWHQLPPTQQHAGIYNNVNHQPPFQQGQQQQQQQQQYANQYDPNRNHLDFAEGSGSQYDASNRLRSSSMSAVPTNQLISLSSDGNMRSAGPPRQRGYSDDDIGVRASIEQLRTEQRQELEYQHDRAVHGGVSSSRQNNPLSNSAAALRYQQQVLPKNNNNDNGESESEGEQSANSGSSGGAGGRYRNMSEKLKPHGPPPLYYEGPPRQNVEDEMYVRDMPETRHSGVYDLHNHLALLEASSKRRVAAATAAKIKAGKKKALTPSERKEARVAAAKARSQHCATCSESNYWDPTDSSIRHRTETKEERDKEEKKRAEITRISVENARLSRKFEMLEKEIKNVREVGAFGYSPSSTPPFHGRRNLRGSNSSGRSGSATGIPIKKGSQMLATRNSGSLIYGGDDETRPWEHQAMNTIHALMAESEVLSSKQKEMRLKEEQLRLKESVVGLREQGITSSDHPSISLTSSYTALRRNGGAAGTGIPDNDDGGEGVEFEGIEESKHITPARSGSNFDNGGCSYTGRGGGRGRQQQRESREQILLAEIEHLKSELFVSQQDYPAFRSRGDNNNNMDDGNNDDNDEGNAETVADGKDKDGDDGSGHTAAGSKGENSSKNIDDAGADANIPSEDASATARAEEEQNSDGGSPSASSPVKRAAAQHKDYLKNRSFNKKPSSYSSGNSGGGSSGKGDKDEMISVKRSDYEALMKDREALDKMVDGMQRENERLMNTLKEKENETARRNAAFFDQQTAMNKEINRLRNANAGVGGHTINDSDQEEDSNDRKEKGRDGNTDNAVGVNVKEGVISMSHDDAVGVQEKQYAGLRHSLNQAARENTSGRAVPFIMHAVRKSADVLRAELANDMYIRSLKDRLAIAEGASGEREIEMKTTIEKLRRDNRELAAAAANVNLAKIHPQDTDYMRLESEHKKQAEEIKHYKERISWYAENQQLLEAAEADKDELKSMCYQMSQELLKRGMDMKTITRLTRYTIDLQQRHQQKAETSQAPSSSTATAKAADKKAGEKGNGKNSDTSESKVKKTQPSSATNKNRSLADIKKIKELEGVIVELQESLLKRNPNSVASLIRATTLSDTAQSRIDGLEEQVHVLQSELDKEKDSYELKMRTMRQLHERLKQRYDDHVEELQKLKAVQPTTTATMATPGGNGEKVGLATSHHHGQIKSLPQALMRLKEQEEETERIRNFYTKRVEEVQRRADAQLRAFKRGGGSAGAGGGHTGAGGGTYTAQEQEQQQWDSNQNWDDFAAQFNEDSDPTQVRIPNTNTTHGMLSSHRPYNKNEHGGGFTNPQQNNNNNNSNNNTRDSYGMLPPPPPPPMPPFHQQQQQQQQQPQYYSSPQHLTPNQPFYQPHTHHSNHSHNHNHNNNGSPGALTVEVAEYKERLRLLQDELMHTAEELGRMRAAAAAAGTPVTSHVHQVPDGSNNNSASSQMALDMIQKQLDQANAQQQQQEQRATINEQKWSQEKDRLETQLSNARSQINELQLALASASANSNRPAEPKTPQMVQFLNMESQLNLLEQRLARREKELMAAVEDAKASARIERARLESIHSQECREKDEKLVHFQNELEVVVGALREMKLAQEHQNNQRSHPQQ